MQAPSNQYPHLDSRLSIFGMEARVSAKLPLFHPLISESGGEGIISFFRSRRTRGPFSRDPEIAAFMMLFISWDLSNLQRKCSHFSSPRNVIVALFYITDQHEKQCILPSAALINISSSNSSQDETPNRMKPEVECHQCKVSASCHAFAILYTSGM